MRLFNCIKMIECNTKTKYILILNLLSTLRKRLKNMSLMDPGGNYCLRTVSRGKLFKRSLTLLPMTVTFIGSRVTSQAK